MPNIWIEKTLTDGRSAEYGLGLSIWSPQRDKSGADIYSNMREIKRNDIIIHLIDNNVFSGISIADSEHQPFICPSGDWKGREGYFIKLKNYIDFQNNGEELYKNDILNEKNRVALTRILDNRSNKGKLFYNRELKLNQGAYITSVPPELLTIINKEFYSKNKHSLPYIDEKMTYEGDDDMQSATQDPAEETFIDFLEARGFSYNVDIIENFLLALKIKPFVILTGNSGSGKTKLAQLFAEYVSTSLPNIMKTTVLVGKSAKSGGWSLNREDFFNKFGSTNYDNNTYPITVNGIEGEAKISMNPRLFLTPTSEEIKDFLNKEEETTKVTLEVRIDSNDKAQHTIVPVGANWTENRHLLGFYNMITSKYQTTDALNLILRSLDSKSIPYLLILDEMNLSHVERYFYDFLSCFESGEEVRLHQSHDESVPESFEIPDNLFVIGTVNVDETTYMFSPKVLDRANTIEFESIGADKYLFSNQSTAVYSGSSKYLENLLLGSNVRKEKGLELIQNISMIDADKQELISIITKIQHILEPHNLSFGFRVIDEMMRFLYVAWEYERSPNNWNNWKRYLDAQIKQKILPKIHGNHSLLDPLNEIFIICSGTDIKDADALDFDSVDYPTSAKKILKMWKILKNQRYVSFVC